MQKQSKLSAALAKRGVGQDKPTTELVAIIRNDSKYVDQKQHHIEPFSVQVESHDGGHVLVGGYGGRYRLQDVHLYASTPQGLVELNARTYCHDD